MRLRHALVGVIAAACLAACTVDKPQPNLVGQDIRLTIIHTSDIHSRLFPYHFTPNKFDQDFGLLPGAGPYGGIARIATMGKRSRKSADRALWLDSGDAWEGAPVFNEYKGEVEIRALSLAGMDGEVLGNHEFALGSQQLFTEIDNWTPIQPLVANYEGRLDLVVLVGENNADPEKRSRIVSFAYNNQPVATFPPGDPNYTPDDPDIANLLWPYSIKLNQDINLNGVFAYINPPGTAKILRNDPSGGDSQLGNLVARSMQQQEGVEAQFAFTNSLGVRADFERGALTNEDMFNVFPFENTIVVIYLSGQEVKDTLDFVSAKSATRGCQSQVQTAGITYDQICRDDPTAPDTCDEPGLGDKPCRCNVIDPNQAGTTCCMDADCTTADPTPTLRADTGRCEVTPGSMTLHKCVQTACSANIYIGDSCRPTDTNTGHVKTDAAVDPATTKCAPMEINGRYRGAVNNYIAAGGAGFFVLKRNTSQQDTGVSLRDALTVYLTKQSPTCDGVDVHNITDANGKGVFDNYGNVACLDDKIEAP